MALSTSRLLFGPGEIVLRNSLHCGQSFRWVAQEQSGIFYSSMRIGDSYDVVTLKQIDDSSIEFGCLNEKNMKLLESVLRDYFRLEVSLTSLLKLWRKVDYKGFSDKEHRGVRVLKQDPWETLCSFICSSNNNVSRITKMCHSLAVEFGDEIGEYDGIKQYSFPTSEQILEKGSEDKLRILGFGYRAKYIIGTAQLMSLEKGNLTDSDFMLSWRIKHKMGYNEMKEKLMSYPGVGPKVADCVLLMGGLGFDEVVPVDVHIARIASRDYNFSSAKQQHSVLQAEYKDLPLMRKKVNYELDVIRRKFQDLWGQYAGWAQCVLFAQEIGKTVGATTNDRVIMKRQLDIYDISVKSELNFDNAVLSSVKIEDEEAIEYSIAGRPLRKSVKKAKVVF